MRAASDPKKLLQCPACGVAAVPLKERQRTALLWHIACPACNTQLRLKWARPLMAGYLVAMVPLVIEVYRIGHGTAHPPQPYL
jgi:hypothetical protein